MLVVLGLAAFGVVTGMLSGVLGVGGRECVEPERHKVLDVQLTRVIVIVDDEHQRPRRNMANQEIISWVLTSPAS